MPETSVEFVTTDRAALKPNNKPETRVVFAVADHGDKITIGVALGAPRMTYNGKLMRRIAKGRAMVTNRPKADLHFEVAKTEDYLRTAPNGKKYVDAYAVVADFIESSDDRRFNKSVFFLVTRGSNPDYGSVFSKLDS